MSAPPNVPEFAAALKENIAKLERGTEAEASANCLAVWEHAEVWVAEKLYAARPALARAAARALGAKPVVRVGGPAWAVIDRLKQLHKCLASARARRRLTPTEERFIGLLNRQTEALSAEYIAGQLDLSVRTVRNIGAKLVRDKRVRSVRGAEGGYLPILHE
jgi:hypothetical protein